jgi:hypothetical protein
LCTELIDGRFKKSFVIKFNDWISSIVILNDRSVVIMTAHNLVALLDIQDGTAVIREMLKCEENSTLYCSFMFGTIWADLLFFAGTALGELIIWRRIDEASKIVHRQFLHNGVIFSMDFNDRCLVGTKKSFQVGYVNFVISFH